MYIVTIYNDGIETQIHNSREKLGSGKIVKGINAIDSFTFSIYPNNAGFDRISEFTTLVKVYNTRKARYDFIGRVLYKSTTMDESGMITKSVTCESVAGYLCDSQQTYLNAKIWTVTELLQTMIDCHNSQVEDYKQFKIGTVTVQDTDENLYKGVQRENTWDAIATNLINILGGELQFRVEEDGNYIDYLEEVGEEKETAIALSVNMKSITQEKDPTTFITRLIPLGAKLTREEEVEDEEGNVTTELVTTEERMTIELANKGVPYIEDEEAISIYGIHVGTMIWDDIAVPGRLLSTAKAWLKANNKVQVKYSITALDLSLIGLALDDFDVGNYHPIKNGLIGIDDTARIIKKNIDICEEVESTIEVGDNFKTLSEIQREQSTKVKKAATNIEEIHTTTTNLTASINNRLVTVEKSLRNQEETFDSKIQQFADEITLEVSGSLGSTANIKITAGGNEYTGDIELSEIRKAFANDPTAISISAGVITFNSNTIVINSTNFSVTSTGVITATSGTVGAITLSETGIYSHNSSYSRSYAGWYRPSTITTATNCLFAGASDAYGTNAKFLVTYGGALTATDATIKGVVTTEYSSYKAVLDGGGLDLYFGGVLCGTINTKYWSGAATEGISLRVEEGGNYIMFSHADDTQGSGYTVDYYLNAGWSSNYEEMHIFQTSARFLDDVYFAGYTRIRSLRLFGSEGEYLVGISSSGQLTVSKL